MFGFRFGQIGLGCRYSFGVAAVAGDVECLLCGTDIILYLLVVLLDAVGKFLYTKHIAMIRQRQRRHAVGNSLLYQIGQARQTVEQ